MYDILLLEKGGENLCGDPLGVACLNVCSSSSLIGSKPSPFVLARGPSPKPAVAVPLIVPEIDKKVN